MKKIKIDSSTIDNISYDINKRLLVVEFIRGAVYQYRCVDYIDVLGILFSDSSGSYFMKHVAKNYEYNKIKD